MEFLYQLPGLCGVEEVDVPRGSIEDDKWEGVCGEAGGDGGRFLVGVTTVFEGIFGLVDMGDHGCGCGGVGCQ